jgi:uncharacterized protein YdhG (YjbR/CyaY superfamily)
MAAHFTSIDDYLSTFAEDVRAVLTKVRQTIHRLVPDAEEAIRYDMPTFTVDGKSLVHFAGWKNHIGIYPMPELDPETELRAARYRTEKGTGRFPLSEPIPYDVIERIVATLVETRTASEGSPRRPVSS